MLPVATLHAAQWRCSSERSPGVEEVAAAPLLRPLQPAAHSAAVALPCHALPHQLCPCFPLLSPLPRSAHPCMHPGSADAGAQLAGQSRAVSTPERGGTGYQHYGADQYACTSAARPAQGQHGPPQLRVTTPRSSPNVTVQRVQSVKRVIHVGTFSQLVGLSWKINGCVSKTKGAAIAQFLAPCLSWSPRFHGSDESFNSKLADWNVHRL